MHTRTYAHVHVRMHAHTHAHACMHAHTHAHAPHVQTPGGGGGDDGGGSGGSEVPTAKRQCMTTPMQQPLMQRPLAQPLAGPLAMSASPSALDPTGGLADGQYLPRSMAYKMALAEAFVLSPGLSVREFTQLNPHIV